MLTVLRKAATCLLVAATVLTPTLADATDGYRYFRLYGRGGAGGPAVPPPQGTLSYQIAAPSTARVGQAWSATSVVSGATGQTSFALKSGTLPPGTVLNAATGAISGVPTVEGPYSAVIGVEDSVGAQGFAGLNVSVAVAMQVAGSPSPAATVGTGYAAQFSASGGSAPYSFSSTSTLPPGLTLSASGLLSGSPSLAGDYPDIVVQAQDQGGTTASSAAFQIRVAAPVAVSWTPTDGQVGISYAASLPTASGGRAPYRYSVSGTVPPGLTFDNTTGGLAGTPVADGSYQVSVVAIDADGRFASTGPRSVAIAPGTVVNNPGPLALSANPPSQAQVGIGYVAHFTASGGSQTAYVYDLSAGTLPDGLALDPSTGVISGAPTTVGTATGLSVRVTDSAFATAIYGPFSIAVAPQPALIVAGNPSSSAQVGVAYSDEFTAFDGSGTGYSFSSSGGALPDGLMLSSVGGVSAQLSGVPAHVGTYPGLKIKVTDSQGHVAETSAFSIVVAAPAGPALAISGSPATSATVGVPYSAQLSASGGSGSGYAFALASGSALPVGLSLDASGAISGSPTTQQTSTFTVEAADSAGDVAQTSFTVQVSQPLAFAGSPTPTNQGASYLFGLASITSGGRAPYSYAIVSGALPAGMTLNGAAVQSTAVSGSTSSAAIRATDADGRAATASLTFVVDPATASAAPGALVMVAGTGTVRAGNTISGTLSTNISGPTWTFAQAPTTPAVSFAPSLDGTTFSAVAPSVAGPTDVTVTATAANGAASQAAAPFTVRLLPQLSVADAASGAPSGAVGVPFAYGPYSFSGVVGTPILRPHDLQYSDGTMGDLTDVAGICPGLSVETATGTISGVPTAACNLPIRMMLTDSYDGTTVVHGSASSWPNHLDGSGSVYQWLADPAPTIDIVDDTATVALASSPHLRTGAAISGALSTNLSGATWSFAQSPSSPGLGLAVSGNSFSGTAPSVASVTSFAVQATATLGSYSKATGFGVVVAPPLSIAAPAQVVADPGVPVSVGPTTGGLGGAPTYALLKGGASYTALSSDCAGLSFSSTTGIVSGTPTATCSVPTLSIRVTDAFDGAIATSGIFAIDPSVVVSGTPAAGAAGEAYSFAPTASGGTGSFVSFAAADSSGTLAGLGLALNASTGAITGTPTAAGTWQGTISATDSHGNVGTSSVLTLTVGPGLSIVASTTNATTAVGETFAGVTVVASGGVGAKTFSAVNTSGTLAALGLSLSASTGAITGSPNAQGTWTGTVKVTDPGNATGAQTASITITVNPAISIVASTTAITTAVGETWGGVTVTTGGGAAPYAYSEVDTVGTLAARGLSLDPSTGAISGTPTSAGTWTGKIKVTDSGNPIGSQTASITITVNAALAVSASATSRTGYVGEAFTAINMTATGGAGTLVFSEVDTAGTLAALGLTLNPATGAIVGPPTAAGAWTGRVRVADPGNATGAQTASITITVNPGLTISGTPQSYGTTGTAYSSAAISASGGSGTNVFSEVDTSGTLAAIGLTLNASTGTITGSTPVAGTWQGAIKVTDAGGGQATTAAVTIAVSAPLTFGGTPPNAVTGSTYSFALSTITSGGRGPMVYAITSGALPTGLSLSSGAVTSNGVNLATTGTGTPTILVTDADGRTVSSAVTFSVTAPTSNAYGWGMGGSGQMGNGTVVDAVKAAAVSGGKTYVKIAANYGSVCGIVNDGSLQCWGVNTSTNTPKSMASPLDSGIVDVAAGQQGQFCAVKNTGTVYCWGAGYGYPASPTAVTGISTAVKVAMQNYNNGANACAILSDNTLRCWSTSSLTSSAALSVKVGTTAIALSKLSIGAPTPTGTYCGVTTGGGLVCWGDANYYQIGNGFSSGTPVASTSAYRVFADGTGVTDVGVGQHSVCAVQGGALKCWGTNYYGDGGTTSSPMPSPTTIVSSGVTAVSLSYEHTCFIQSGGAYCMGDGSNGDLGNNSTSQRNAPVQVQPVLGGLSSITTGVYTSFAF